MKRYIIIFLIILFNTTYVYADCKFNGKDYPTGTRIGPFVCSADGSWK